LFIEAVLLDFSGFSNISPVQRLFSHTAQRNSPPKNSSLSIFLIAAYQLLSFVGVRDYNEQHHSVSG